MGIYSKEFFYIFFFHSCSIVRYRDLNELIFSNLTLWAGQKINVLASANALKTSLQPFTYVPPDKWDKIFSLPRLSDIPYAADPTPAGSTDEPTNDEREFIPQRTQIWEDGVNNPISRAEWKWYKEKEGKMVETDARSGPSFHISKVKQYSAVEPNPYELWILAQYWGINLPKYDPNQPNHTDTYYLRARPVGFNVPFFLFPEQPKISKI